HRVTSLVASTLGSVAEQQGAVIPEAAQRAARTLARGASRRAILRLRQVAEAAHIFALFSSAGIRCLHLKGAPLSERAFGDIGLRDSRDVDLLIEPRHLRRADSLLRANSFARIKPTTWPARGAFAGLGARVHSRYAHEFVYSSASGTTVEIKTRL